MNNTELTPEEIERLEESERLVKIKDENDKIKEMLKNSAYVLISSFTARKAFLSAVDEMPETEEPLAEVFARGAKEVRADELKKLQERIALYQ